MKKIFLLALALVMLTALFVPTTSFALTYSADVKLNKNFSDFTTDNPHTLGGTDANSVLSLGANYGFYGNGTAATFTPAKGVFGKAADDTSVKIDRTVSTGTSRMYGGGKLLPTGNLGANEYVVMNWNWAFADTKSVRTATADFYMGTQTSYSGIKPYYADGATSSSVVLSVSPSGEIKLFNKALTTNVVLNLNSWYNFEVRIKNGDTANSVKSLAELYIDGIKIGETNIVCASNYYQLNGLGWFYFDAAMGVTYVDDLQIGYFKSNASNDVFTEMQQSFELTSKSDAYVTDKIHIDLKNHMTVEEFLADVSYNRRTETQTGITEVKVLKSDWSEAQATDVIEDGWYARIKVEGDWNGTSGRNVYRYYYRKFSPVTYYANDYETSAHKTPGLSMQYGQYWADVTNVAGVETDGGLSGGRAAYAWAKDRAEANSYLMFRYHTGTKTLPQKYTMELSVLRSSTYDTFPAIKVEVGGKSVIYMDNDNVMIGRAGQATFGDLISKPNAMRKKWVHLAIEVDGTEATLFVNGNKTELEYSLVNHNIFASGINGLKIYPATGIPANVTGGIYVDNFKVYSGSYSPVTLEVKSENYNTAANETITVAGNVTVADFKAATGAVSVYTYADGKFTAEVTDGNIADGHIAVFKDAKGKVRYFDIELLPIVSDVTFTEENGKVTATVTVENRCENHVITSGLLVIANRSNDEVYAVNLDQKNDISALGTHTFTADVNYADNDKVIAYFWDKNLKPFDNSKAEYTK